jgi:single-strand DNA-binding protein
MNKVMLIGRLGKDPEKRVLDSGAAYVRFSLATDESYKDAQGNWQEQTEWHNIVLWREQAERAEKTLKQGYMIYLEGKLTYRSWKDQDGQDHYITEIRGLSFRLLKKTMKDEIASYEQNRMTEPPEYAAKANAQAEPAMVQPPIAVETDDLPF